MTQTSSSYSLPTPLHADTTVGVQDLAFAPDELGAGFGHHFIELGKDPDKETPIRCTLVQYKPAGGASYFSRPALLFVHGMTDYFFQAHVAEFFHAQGFAVYGLDLRKCGRSWREGQTWHHVSDQSLYDADLTVATTLITNSHPNVTVFGHSTGGLDVTMWAARLHRAAVDMPEGPSARLHTKLAAVVLNSPWFGLQFDPLTTGVITYVFPIAARLFPKLPLPGGINPLYGKSIHASEQGEWNYNLEFKPLTPRPKRVSWLVGVSRAIQQLHSGQYSTGVPTLLICSDKHHFGGREVNEATYTSDVILKPEQMHEFARCANKDITVAVIKDAVHDVFLSRKPVREEALQTTLEWLKKN